MLPILPPELKDEFKASRAVSHQPAALCTGGHSYCFLSLPLPYLKVLYRLSAELSNRNFSTCVAELLPAANLYMPGGNGLKQIPVHLQGKFPAL